MWAGYLGFALLSINPIGGLLASIPYATFVLHVPPFWAALIGLPLAYVQVVAVDVLWSSLQRIGAWQRLLERRRSPRLQQLATTNGGFWATVVFSPFLGPWLVMAAMRFAHVPHRRVALPLALGLAWNGMGIAFLCEFAPRLLPH